MVKPLKYDFFAGFVDQFISDDELQKLTTKFEADKFDDAPEEIINEIDKFFKKKWRDNADAKPSRGNASTQKKNFETFLQKDILTRKKLKYKDNAVTGNDIDFNPMFARYREIVGEAVPIEKVSRRVIKALALPEIDRREQLLQDGIKLIKRDPNRFFGPRGRPLRTEQDLNRLSTNELEIQFGGLIKKPVKPKRFSDRIIRAIDRAKEQKKVEDLIFIRDSMRELTLKKKEVQPISTIKALELFRKAEKALEPFEQKQSLFAIRSDDELKRILKLKGVNIRKELKGQKQTTENIRALARKFDIGLRNYEMTREELIDDIMEFSSYTKAFLDERPDSFLKDLRKNLKKEVIAPKRRFFLKFDDLPISDEGVNNFFTKRKETVPTALKVSEGNRIRKIFPFLSEKGVKAEVNRRVAATVAGAPVYELEVEKRYMEWKYGDPERKPSFNDLVDISKITFKDFNKILARRDVERIDPVTKKKKIIKEFLPKEGFTSFRNDLKNRLNKREKIIDRRAEEIARDFAEDRADVELEVIEDAIKDIGIDDTQGLSDLKRNVIQGKFDKKTTFREEIEEEIIEEEKPEIVEEFKEPTR